MKKSFIPDREILKTAFSLSWPAILETFFITFAGLVDSYMVSSLGSAAVAAVGLTTQPKFIGMAMFIALSVSVSALVARRRGEERRDSASNIALTAFLFTIIMSIMVSLFFVTFASPIMRFCGSSENTHDMATQYYRIIMAGMIFNTIQNCVNAAQRGCGNTRITMKTNLTSNALNVVLNYCLIGGHFGFPALGITGAALATVLGSVAGCLISIASISSSKTYISIPYMLKERIRPSFDALKNLIKIGYSIFIEQILMRAGFMATAIMAAKQGDYAMAAHQVGMNTLALSFSFGDGLQAAAVALIGHSLGAKDKERAYACGSACRFIGGIISVCLATVFFLGARTLYSLFFVEEEIIAIGIHIMWIIIIVCVFQIAQVIYMGCLRGAGDTFYTAVASTISATFIRTIVSYIFGYTLGFGIEGIWMGILADQIGRFLFGSIRFKKGNWVNIRI